MFHSINQTMKFHFYTYSNSMLLQFSLLFLFHSTELNTILVAIGLSIKWHRIRLAASGVSYQGMGWVQVENYVILSLSQGPRSKPPPINFYLFIYLFFKNMNVIYNIHIKCIFFCCTIFDPLHPWPLGSIPFT